MRCLYVLKEIKKERPSPTMRKRERRGVQTRHLQCA
jgi:hypothetical protein